MTPSARKPSKRTAPARASNHGGTLFGLFMGLALGLVIALGIAWYFRQAPLPFENKFQTPPAKPAAPAATAPATEPKALPLPGKTSDAKPRFDFYGILEGKQAATPPGDAKPVAPAPLPAPAATAPVAPVSTAPAAPASKEVLYLQVGAFQKAADADNARAKLSLMGFDAEIHEADVPEKGTMYRVRSGPYHSLEEMNKARNTLSQNGIQATLVKGK